MFYFDIDENRRGHPLKKTNQNQKDPTLPFSLDCSHYLLAGIAAALSAFCYAELACLVHLWECLSLFIHITDNHNTAALKPHDPTFPSNQIGTKDSKALVVAGNGLAADSVFGDVFSVTSSQPKHDTLVPTSSASGLPLSSAIIPASGSQPTAKPSPLRSFQSTSTQQSMGNHHQEVQSTVK
ncbi:hypothetical protein F0562_015354 [Nyssa sinensis]|uniref:Uncharacterized protein n=1 Tax=Nyssa sinensis TaxID=561372 RepID=A0A5J4ZKS7_9ASTE|nr:hypothetical protein F0562_015354 [Nyssa sinensis]